MGPAGGQLGFCWGLGPSGTCLHPCPPQVQPEVDDVESCLGGAQQWGRLQLSLEYDFGSQEVRAPHGRPRSVGTERGRVQG